MVTILGIEVAAALAAGVALRRMGYDSYPQAVIDAVLALLAPVALCIVFIVVGYRAGAFYADIPLIVWLPALGSPLP